MRTKLYSKVCIINCFDTYEHRADLLHEYFKKHGAQVSIYTSDFRHIDKCQRHNYRVGYTYFHAIPYYKNISIVRLFSHIILAKNIFNEIKRQNYDLIWVMLPPNSLAQEAAKYKKNHMKVKMVYDLLDLWPETMPISKMKTLPPFLIWKNLRDNNLDMADAIVTECNLYHRKLPDRIQNKIYTVYLARKIKKFHPRIELPENKIALCYLGSINNIIDICGIVVLINKIKKCKPVEFHIIGDGEKRDELIMSCKKAGADVIFHGKIFQNEKKQDIFNKCHYGLNYMKNTVVVGLTMKSMDYFEAGLPIINNIHGDTWDIIANNKLGFNSDNLSSIIDYDISLRKNVRNYFEDNFSVDAFERNIDYTLKAVYKNML